MPIYNAPLEDFRFLFHEFLDLEACRTLDSMAEATPDVIDAVLEEFARLAEDVLQPLNAVGDREGCQYADGEVRMPSGFADAWKTYTDGSWLGLTCDPEYGGQGLPGFVGLALTEMINSANPSFAAYAGLTHGAYEVINGRGTDEQKQRFLPAMCEGRWTGTMNLTEAHCGTDLGLLRTRAEPQNDGTYRIFGTKIWITAGEHDMSDNIIHLVLARLPDAPEGVRGISAFIVPKFHVDADGNAGERNAVRCESIEHKMGQSASSTCELVYDGAVGELIGPENKGLSTMFIMMNAARMVAGVQGLSMAVTAYQNAGVFARERLQGRALDGARYPDKPADPILVHPDVRRMLLTSRALVEGCRGLVMYTGVQHELEHHHADADVRAAAGHWVALTTPIIKAFFTDIGTELTNMGMQVHGGAGYVTDTGVEQFVRDVRITQIYEGTNGIQALDLVGRKLTADSGATLKSFFDHAGRVLEETSDTAELEEFTAPFKAALGRLQDTTAWLYQQMSRDPNEAGAASSDYLRMFALTALAFVWTRQAAIASRKLAAKEGHSAFYEAKLTTARFFMTRILPETLGLDAKIRAGAGPIMNPPDEAV